ncbi:hypothetical protein GCM10007977_031180 [Dactylosporangium sucinum]|uniref:SprT-like domain-containing protein n=2 Tax=Dactylosporangium sucinum TaxID=1424081 RepID=A0A917WTF1_9ACTN|nr:hypothetical protein GCM10007977_031180 [Dactylosporangium sucinum]
MTVEPLFRTPADTYVSTPADPAGSPDAGFSAATLVAALEGAWAAIRRQHPEVPAVVLVVGDGSPKKANQRLTYGHFDSHRWQSGTDRLPEVMVSGEGLSRDPAKVFTTLLHEAAHGLAFTRGIQDTSRQGRWHNKQFAKLAAELGMTTEKDDKLGFSPCTLTDIARQRYAPVIGPLGAALRSTYRHPDEPSEGKTRTNNNNGVSCECECPRKLRVSVAVFDAGGIFCPLCTAWFLPEDTDRDEYTAANPIPGTATGGNDHEDQDDDTGDGAETEGDDLMVFYDPTGAKYGLPTYPFKFAPDGLATIRQLRAQGLRPGGQDIAAQILWRRGKRRAYLYRIDRALPKREATPAQREALDKAMRVRRTCTTCGQIKPYVIPRSLGECLDCAPGGAS